MQDKYRRWGSRLFTAFTVLVALSYLLVCLVPYVDPGSFWFIAMLGLGFPVLLLFLLICLVILLLRRRLRFALGLFIVLLAGWQQVSVAVGFNLFQSKFEAEKDAKSLRVLLWNVSRWDEPNKKAKGGLSFRTHMMDAIYLQNADVLCLQEFFEPRIDGYYEHNISALEAMGYSYHYFYTNSAVVNGAYQFGLFIASKYPIVDSGKVSFGETPHSEGLAWADINFNDQRYRVYNVHMESARMDRYAYFDAAEGARHAASQLIRAYIYRSGQADLVRQQINTSPNPVIVCSNLGDIPNSYAYFTVSEGLQDVFLEKGVGLGTTFRFISPTLRLDYLFTDPRFKVRQYHRPRLIYSDHYPLIADLEYRK